VLSIGTKIDDLEGYSSLVLIQSIILCVYTFRSPSVNLGLNKA